MGQLLYFARRYEEALTELRQAGDMQPNSPVVESWIAMSYLKKGMADETAATHLRWHSAIYGLDAAAQEIVLTAYSANGLPGFWKKLRALVQARAAMNVHASYHLAEISAFVGDIDEAFRWREKAYQ